MEVTGVISLPSPQLLVLFFGVPNHTPGLLRVSNFKTSIYLLPNSFEDVSDKFRITLKPNTAMYTQARAQVSNRPQLCAF